MKKYTWTDDEMILLLDIFFRYLPNIIDGKINKNLDVELNKLSNLLRSINVHSNDFNTNPNYRNTNGMKMMIQNLRYIYHFENGTFPYKGLSQYPRYFLNYFRKYSNRQDLLTYDLNKVTSKHNLI